MALRLMQIALPKNADGKAEKLLEGKEIVGVWEDPREKTRQVIQVLVPAEEAEELTDKLASWYEHQDGFRITLIPISATVPRDELSASDKEQSPEGAASALRDPGRVSREELLHLAEESLGVNRVFLAMAFLASVVAAVGLVRDDVAVIIGAMVIAPLLGPNVAMALAVTLGDFALLRRALMTNIAGFCVGLGVAIVIGRLPGVELNADAIASRTNLQLSDLALALAAGSAGAFALSRGLAGALIGVMVAVALMPPLVVFGLMVAQFRWEGAAGAALLVSANVISVNLAGVATFVAQGVSPRRWWDEEKAKKATRRAVALWLALLLVLISILVTRQYSSSVKSLGPSDHVPRRTVDRCPGQ